MAESAAAQELLGPIDYLVLEFPNGAVDGSGFGELARLVDTFQVNVLDLEFFAKDEGGALKRVEAHDIHGAEAFDLELFDGAAAGLLLADDIDQVGTVIAPGSVAPVLVYEVLTLLPAIAAWQAGGAKVVAEGPILAEELEEVLDTIEA